MLSLLPIELEDGRLIRRIEANEIQAALELKRVAISETYCEWATARQIEQELRAVASLEYFDAKIAEPESLLLGQWSGVQLQALGGIKLVKQGIQLFGGAAWPVGIGLAAPVTETRLQLARSLGFQSIGASCIQQNRLSAKHLRHHGFSLDGSSFKYQRAPGWTTISWLREL